MINILLFYLQVKLHCCVQVISGRGHTGQVFKCRIFQHQSGMLETHSLIFWGHSLKYLWMQQIDLFTPLAVPVATWQMKTIAALVPEGT